MNNLPFYVPALFVATTGLAVFLFLKANPNPKKVFLLLTLWLAIQAVLGISGFYKSDGRPPRLLFALLPPLLFIASTFLTTRGRNYLSQLDAKHLTLLHSIRVPVEIVLLWLMLAKAVPQRMTFEGQNFDILSGLTAPVVYYFGYVRRRLPKAVLLLWNFLCLGLLINIVTVAVLAAPTPFQKLAFDQPNVAVLYFPFNWLAACVVPLVLFSHLACIRQLLAPKNQVRSLGNVHSKAA